MVARQGLPAKPAGSQHAHAVPHGHQHPHAHPHPHPAPHHPHAPAAAKPKGHGLLYLTLFLVGLAAAGGGVLFLKGGGGPSASPEALAEQIEAVSGGRPSALNVYGGTINVEVSSGQVTVDGIPPNACVSAGWQLVRKGTLTVNGVLPLRVSAAKLSELCNMYDTAQITWSPKPPE